MRRSTSVATALLAAGAGWLAAKMWQENTYGVRDRVREGSDRMRSQGERLRARGREMSEEIRRRGEEAWERGRNIAEERLGQGKERGRSLSEREQERMRAGSGYGERGDYGASGPYGESYGDYGRGGQSDYERRAGKSAERSAEAFRSQRDRDY